MRASANKISSVKTLSVVSIRNSAQVQGYSNFRPHWIHMMLLGVCLSHLLAECSVANGHQKPQTYLLSVWQPQRRKKVPVPTVSMVIQVWLSLDQLGSCQLLTNHCELGMAHIFWTDLSLGPSPMPRGWSLSYLNYKDKELGNGRSPKEKWVIYRRMKECWVGTFTPRPLMSFSERIIILWTVLGYQWFS